MSCIFPYSFNIVLVYDGYLIINMMGFRINSSKESLLFLEENPRVRPKNIKDHLKVIISVSHTIRSAIRAC